MERSRIRPDLGNAKVIMPFMGGVIEHAADHSHLDCIIGAESDRTNIERTISYFYTKLNILVRDLCKLRHQISICENLLHVCIR